ncbi:MAG: alpha/beta fold hydrolase [Pseudomonadota bacterium]
MITVKGSTIARHAVLLAASISIALLFTSSPARSDPFEACHPAPVRHSAAEEQEIAIETPDGRILGTLAKPSEAPPRALALLLHGYTGSRNEIRVARGEGMFTRTARAFAERGIATLRIDFIGSGRSDGEWADTRFSGQARDAARASQALRDRFSAPSIPLGVLGYSQGGLVALRSAAGGGAFDRLTLWNPVMDPMTTYGKIFGRETVLEGARRHDQTEDRAIVSETRLRPGFFAEIVAADPIADAARVEAPVMIVTGQRDPLVIDGAALAAQIASGRAGETTILDLNAGHDLGALREPALLDQVIACTAGFLLADIPS